jgi:hypothetical protein
VGLEWGPLSLVSTNEELFERNSHADHVAPSNPQKLALASPTCGGRSVSIVRSRTQAMDKKLSSGSNCCSTVGMSGVPFFDTVCKFRSFLQTAFKVSL